ncbi:MAG TPA: flagellar hook-basal body protein [Candidatus Bathyarchaeia archaeon]|nr:flagellar hook-basal body protein [Candidatus Bathyarchaeia archaeon]
MLKGLYAAATGLMALEQRQAVIANNISNASTAGFRRQEPVQKGFRGVFLNRMARPGALGRNSAPGGGALFVETFTDTRRGAITTTGDPLTVALEGPGFLAVDTPRGERFTRSGNLAIDTDGQLATPDGYKILAAGGTPLSVGGGKLSIAEDGMVYEDGQEAGQLRVVEFEDDHMLTREGKGLYRASDSAMARSADATNTRVIHEALEMSNVNLPNEMIGMILGLRAYEANQKYINTIDETMGRLIDQIGMGG